MSIFSSTNHFFRTICILLLGSLLFVACTDPAADDSNDQSGPSNAAELTGFRVDGSVAVVDPTNASQFSVMVPDNRDTSSLDVSDVTVSAGASLTAPAPLTAVNFTSPVTFTVTAADGKTTKNYTVTVNATAASDAAELKSFKVDGNTAVKDSTTDAFTVEVLKTADVNSLDITEPMISAGASLTAPASLTGVNFSSPVTFTVTAADSVTTKNYTVTVSAMGESNAAELESFQVDGVAAVSSGTDAFTVTIPKNRDKSSLDVTEVLTSAGASVTAPTSLTTVNFTNPVTFTVTAADTTTTKDYTVTVNATAPSDAAELMGFKVYDVAAVSSGTDAFTVTIPKNRDKSSLKVTEVMTSDGANLTAPTSLATVNFASAVTFTVTAEDGTTTKNYTVTVNATAPSDAAELISLKVDGVAAVEDSTSTNAFTVEVLSSRDVASLDITEPMISADASLTAPAPLTAVDFSSPVTFTVTAADGKTTKNYTVTVNATAANNAAELKSFKVYDVAAVSSGTDAFTVTIPKNRSKSSLKVTEVETSAGASVTAPTSLTTVNFTNPVTFTVTAADTTTTKDYTVTVNATAPSDAAELKSLKVGGAAARVSDGKFYVDVPIPELATDTTKSDPTSLADVTSLAVTEVMASDGASVTAPTSLTSVDFSKGVTFTVTAEDGTTKKNYTGYAIPILPFAVKSVKSLPDGGTVGIKSTHFAKSALSKVQQLVIELDSFPSTIELTGFEVASGSTATMNGSAFGVGSQLRDLKATGHIFTLQVKGPDGLTRPYELAVTVTAKTGVDFKIGTGQTVADTFKQLDPTSIGATEAAAIEIGDEFGEITTSDDSYSFEYTVSTGASVRAKIGAAGYVSFASGTNVTGFSETGTKIIFEVTNQVDQKRYYYVTVKKPSTTPELTELSATVGTDVIMANPLPTRAERGAIVAPGADFSALMITVTTAEAATAVTASGKVLTADAAKTTFTGTVDATKEFTIRIEGGSGATPREYKVIATEKSATFLALISGRPELSKFKELIESVTDTDTKEHFTDTVAETLFAPTNTVINTYLAAPTGGAAASATVVSNRFAELKTNQTILKEFLRSFILWPDDGIPGGGLKMTKAQFQSAGRSTFVSLGADGDRLDFGRRVFVSKDSSTSRIYFTKNDKLSINPFDLETINGVVHIVEGNTSTGAYGNIRSIFSDTIVNTPLAAK